MSTNQRLTPEREAEIRSSSNSEYGNYIVQKVYKQLLAEIDALRAERDEALKVRSIRTCPNCGEQMVNGHGAKLMDELTELRAERDSLEKLNNDSVTEFCQKLAASEAREVMLRGALEKIERAYPLNGDRMAHQDYAKKILSSTVSPPLLAVLREVEELIVKIAALPPEYWLNRAAFCEEALASLRQVLGGGG